MSVFKENTDPRFLRALKEQQEAERTASRKQAILAVARGRAKRELAEEAKQKAERESNRAVGETVGFAPGYAEARQRLEAREAGIAAIEAELAAIDRTYQARMRTIAIKRRALAAIARVDAMQLGKRRKR